MPRSARNYEYITSVMYEFLEQVLYIRKAINRSNGELFRDPARIDRWRNIFNKLQVFRKKIGHTYITDVGHLGQKVSSAGDFSVRTMVHRFATFERLAQTLLQLQTPSDLEETIAVELTAIINLALVVLDWIFKTYQPNESLSPLD